MPFVLIPESNEVWLPKVAKSLNPLAKSSFSMNLYSATRGSSNRSGCCGMLTSNAVEDPDTDVPCYKSTIRKPGVDIYIPLYPVKPDDGDIYKPPKLPTGPPIPIPCGSEMKHLPMRSVGMSTLGVMETSGKVGFNTCCEEQYDPLKDPNNMIAQAGIPTDPEIRCPEPPAFCEGRYFVVDNYNFTGELFQGDCDFENKRSNRECDIPYWDEAYVVVNMSDILMDPVVWRTCFGAHSNIPELDPACLIFSPYICCEALDALLLRGDLNNVEAFCSIFLNYLGELYNVDINIITGNRENCCSFIFDKLRIKLDQECKHLSKKFNLPPSGDFYGNP
jgi:hypothetical protein